MTFTVQELIEKLSKLPGNMPVYRKEEDFWCYPIEGVMLDYIYSEDGEEPEEPNAVTIY